MKLLQAILLIVLTLLLIAMSKPMEGSLNKEIVDKEQLIRNILFSEFPWMTESKFAILYEKATEKKIDIFLLVALIQVESSGNARAKGKWVYPPLMRKDGSIYYKKSRAYGLMQVMDYNYSGSTTKLLDISININRGTEILNKCIDKFKDKKHQLRCYNAGAASDPKKYRNWVYVRKILKIEQSLREKELVYGQFI